MQLYRGVVESTTDSSADLVFADVSESALVIRLRGGHRQEASPTGSERVRGTLSLPDYVLTDQRGRSVGAHHSADFSATLPGTVDVVIYAAESLDLSGRLTLTAKSDPIMIEFRLIPL